MKRSRLFLLSILTLVAVAWAAYSIWLLFKTGMGPLGLFSMRELASVIREGRTLYYYQFHFNWLAVLGAFLPLILVGAFWVWRWGKRLTMSKPDGG